MKCVFYIAFSVLVFASAGVTVLPSVATAQEDGRPGGGGEQPPDRPEPPDQPEPSARADTSVSGENSPENYDRLKVCPGEGCLKIEKAESCQTMTCRMDGKTWRVRLCVWHNFQGHPCFALNRR